MKILVTGGSGFLAAWVIRRLLARGIDIRAFDLRRDDRLVSAIAPNDVGRVEWFTGDIASGEDVARALTSCSGVIHLAGVLTPTCAENPILGAQINLIGTLHVFEAARRAGIKQVLYASSAGVFGPDDGVNPHPETHYGTFKLACEGSARAYWNDADISSVGYRPLVIYGAGRESGSSAGPSLACRAAALKSAYTIPFTGSTGLIFADDVAAAYEAALLNPLSGAHVFTLAGDTTAIPTVIDMLSTISPEAKIDAAGPPLPIASHYPVNVEWEAAFPGIQKTSLADGLRQTVDFYRHRSPG